MSENTEFDHTAAEPEEEPAAEGQYVAGDYGAAGATGENPAGAEEGEYPTGDYGDAGVSSPAAVGAPEGDYPEGDYGDAGDSAATAVGSEEGDYPEGDYGAAGDSRTGRAADSGPAGREAADKSDREAHRGDH
ncbi:hypothetical protein ACOM2C_11345 [Pseudarthrobacter sp. So.54]